MLFRSRKPSPDPALEVEFRRKMGRRGKPRELHWIELADRALAGPAPKPQPKSTKRYVGEERRKAA
jgi:hypothetical protein